MSEVRDEGRFLAHGEGLTRGANVGVALQEISDTVALIGRFLCGETLSMDLARIPDMLERAAHRLRRALIDAHAPPGSKLNPGNHDCLSEALPDEPLFVLLARDLRFAKHVMEWAEQREVDVAAQLQPESDLMRVAEARSIADRGVRWREYRMGAWRHEHPGPTA